MTTTSRQTFLIALTLFLASTVLCIGQTDTTTKEYRKWNFGISVSGTFSQMNFSGLRKYDYLLDKPSNYYGGLTTTFIAGNREKLFGSFIFDHSFGSDKMGTYNNYNITSGAGWTAYGISLTVPYPYDRLKTKFIKGFYCSVGAQQVSLGISSRAVGHGIVNADTSFHFESSKAKTLLINGELMFEFLNLRNSKKYHYLPPLPLAIKIGYNFQIQDPKWTGTYYRNSGDENPKVNLGGFYIGLGFNAWILAKKK
jgi:hypothetical protein